ncbi:MAG: LuxR C-terminal-related transcriptional regulator [Pseudomonadales bacterium]|nr:LuxR C-terminal-related transcriptional regulator [Pseudomonadales bacterium]
MLLQTKFFAPASNPKTIVRSRLLDELANSAGKKISLVIAPAGYGKTTLVSQWVHHVDNPFTWLSLDGSDNEPRRFWQYIIGAFQRIYDNVGHEANKLLNQADFECFEGAITSLVNDLSLIEEPNLPVYLVLDDFHHIQDFDILRNLVYFVDYLPPTVQLILTSRTEPVLPLSRWRVRNYLVEIYATDLAFSDEECLRFFNEYMAKNISLDEAKKIRAKTEGWVAAMQLAAISKDNAASQRLSTQAALYSGSDKLINEYVLTEILDQQPDNLKSFLLQSSCLLRLNGEFCDAVLDQDNSQEVLEDLEQSNLFIIPLDTSHQWYRYHDLFRESLYHRLKLESPDNVTTLQRKAITWLLEHDQIHESIDQLIQLQDWDWLKTVLTNHGNTLIHDGYHLPMLDWIALLSPREVETTPRLQILKIWSLFFSNRIENIPPLLENLEDLLDRRVADSAPDAEDALAINSEISLIRSYLARTKSDLKSVNDLTRRVLEDIDNSNMPLKSVTYYGIGIDAFNKGDFNDAINALRSSIQYGKFERKPSGVISSTGLLSWILLHMGELKSAVEEFNQTQEWLDSYLSDPSQPKMISCWQNGALCEIYKEKNELTIAQSYLAPLLGHLEVGTEPSQHIIIQYIRAQLFIASGEYGQALECLEDASELYASKKEAIMFEPPYLEGVKIKCFLALNQKQAIEQWLSNQSDNADFRSQVTRELNLLAQARAHNFLGDHHAALHKLDLFIDETRERGHNRHLIESLINRSVAHYLAHLERGEDLALSVRDMTHAMTLASRHQILRVFVDEPLEQVWQIVNQCDSIIVPYSFRKQLMECFTSMRSHAETVTPDTENSPAVSDTSAHAVKAAETISHGLNRKDQAELIEPLSARELEVLFLINDGLANKQIAAKLSLAPATVKAHIRNLYGKMAVKSRTEALAKARQLALLERN